MRTHIGWVVVSSGIGLALVGCKAKRDASASIAPSIGAPGISAPGASPSVAATPAKLTTDVAVLFERVLPTHHNGAPAFGPDQRINVGPRRWSRDGAYLGLHRWSRNGQMTVAAEAGPATAPLLLVSAWADAQMPGAPKDVPDGSSFVLTVPPDAAVPTHVALAGAEYQAEGSPLTLSPDGTRYAIAERAAMVVRALDGTVVASAPYARGDGARDARVCWRDAAAITWLALEQGQTMLRTLQLDAAATPRIATSVPLPSQLQGQAISFASCDPGGGAAMIELANSVAVLDLASGVASTVASLAAESSDDPPAPLRTAVGAHGQRVAVSVGGSVTLYQHNANTWQSLWQRKWPSRAQSDAPFGALQVAFSTDGNRLAVVGGTLVVVGPANDVVAPLAPPSTFDFTLPKTFADINTRVVAADGETNDSSWYGQLPTVSGFALYPHELLHAFRDTPTGVDVVALALDASEFQGHVPSATATDADLVAFAKYLMPRLFDHWNSYDIVDSAAAAMAALPATTDRDPSYSLKVGRTDGKPWFETRELQRDGCEPYDGYTKVVVDGHELFVVRALTYPGGPIQGWLDKFFDVPFGVKVQIARRKGPTMGPC